MPVLHSRYRLTSFRRGQLNPAGDAITGDPPADTLRSQSWTELDNNGNRIESEWAVQRDGSVETHEEERVVDGVNEIATRYLDDDDPNTPLGQIGISYDLAGNLTHDEEHAYHYDALSRLRSVYTITGVALLHIKYDALGRAVERQVGQNGPVTYYVYDVPTPGGPNGYAVAQEYDDDNLLREFIHRSGHLRPVAMVDYTDAGAISEGLPETFWYLYDERGSVVAITDDAGIVVEQYRYDPYGGATVYDGSGAVIATWTDPNSWDDRALTPSAIGNPYGFTGHRFSVAGLYETPFRAYSPELGRWLQRDPLGYVDGMNLYQYVLRKPMLLIDPFGLEWMDGVKSFAREVDAAAVRVLDRTAEAMVGAWDAGISAVSDPGGTAKAVHDGVFNGIATAEQDLIASYHKFTASGNSWFDAGTGLVLALSPTSF